MGTDEGKAKEEFTQKRQILFCPYASVWPSVNLPTQSLPNLGKWWDCNTVGLINKKNILIFFLCVTTDPKAVSRLMALTCTQKVHIDFGTISVPNSCKGELEHSANSGRVWQSPVINVLLLFLFVKVVKIMTYEMIYFCLFGSSPAFQQQGGCCAQC